MPRLIIENQISSGQPLTDAHFQSFIYQTLCGLKYIHSANVLHCHLKPGDLLVNADCELKICDFGLSRGYIPKGGTPRAAENPGFLTETVQQRWYCAPESFLSSTYPVGHFLFFSNCAEHFNSPLP